MDLRGVYVFRKDMVPVVDGVCELCGKTNTSGEVSVVYRHSQLPPVFGEGGGVDCRVTAR